MKVTDPMCGMTVDSITTAATYSYQDHAFYFCSTACHDKFKANPEQYARKAATSGAKGAGSGGHDHRADRR